MSGTTAITPSVTFGGQVGSIALSLLDTNFTQVATFLNNANNYSNYLVDTGAANSIVVTTPTSVTATYTAGLLLAVKVIAANTGASTINVNSLGSKNILNPDGSALVSGQMPINSVVALVYDGTQFLLAGGGLPANIAGGTKGQVPVQSAAGTTTFMDSSFAFKNRIINGAMGISQRTAVNTNVAVTTTSSGTFGPDRFWGYTGTASLWNILQVTTGLYDFPYACRIQRIAGQTSTSAIYAGQTIETNNCIDLSGQTVTLSFYATAGANYSGGAVTVQLLTGTAADQGTNSLNSGTWTGLSAPLSSTFTPTTTRTKFTFTATIGSTVQEMSFRFNWSGSGTAGAADYIDITSIQLEKGSTATTFDYRPYGTELALCQRYFQLMDMGYVYSYAPSGNQISSNYTFPVAMRASPTIAVVTNPTFGSGTSVSSYQTTARMTAFFMVTNGAGYATWVGGQFSAAIEL